MGCIWDIAPKRERIWLYGSAWLWMFDLGQDMPKPSSSETEEDEKESNEEFQSAREKKRKRRKEKQSLLTENGDNDASNKKRRRKDGDTGAGDRIPAHEMRIGIGRSVRKTIGASGKDATIISLDAGEVDQSDSEDPDDGDEESSSSALVHLRRGNSDAMIENDAEEKSKEEKQRLPYWGTYKYRPVLGIVPIGSAAVNEDISEDSKGVEVAIIERPMFDVDLPGRYYGDQEWQEKKDAGDIVR